MLQVAILWVKQSTQTGFLWTGTAIVGNLQNQVDFKRDIKLGFLFFNQDNEETKKSYPDYYPEGQ